MSPSFVRVGRAGGDKRSPLLTDRLGMHRTHHQNHGRKRGRLRWTESDPAKLAVAARVCRETTVTLKWMSHRLQAGTWKSLNAKLHRWRKVHEKEWK